MQNAQQLRDADLNLRRFMLILLYLYKEQARVVKTHNSVQ